MPFYDYFCENCDETSEQRHSINESPIIKCEKCGQSMQKIISGRKDINMLHMHDGKDDYDKDKGLDILTAKMRGEFIPPYFR